jgi:hypothetical protein
MLIQAGADLLAQGRVFDDHAHFGIEHGRARIEVEGADKELLAVDREGLGMQAGARAARGGGAAAQRCR